MSSRIKRYEWNGSMSTRSERFDCSNEWKMRRKAYRIHPTASRTSPVASIVIKFESDRIVNVDTSQNSPFSGQQGNVSSNPNKTENIFKNIFIPPEALNQKLPVYSKKDERNFELTNSLCSAWERLDKHEALRSTKRRNRKIPFHEVVASAKDFLKEREAKKKKEKSNILNDLASLKEALPTIEEGECQTEMQTSVRRHVQKETQRLKRLITFDNRPRASKPFAVQNAEMMEDLQAYHQRLTELESAADPFDELGNTLKQ